MYAHEKEKERLRGVKRRASGKIKKVADMTPNEQKKFREKNRVGKARERNLKKCTNNENPKSRKTENRLRRKLVDLQKKLKEKDQQIVKLKRQSKKSDKSKESAPITSAKQIMKRGPPAVFKRLVFCESLVEQLKDKKKDMKTERDQSIFAQVISGKILKKYKMLGQAKGIVSKYYEKKNTSRKGLILSRSQKIKTTWRMNVKKNIKEFLEKDENSTVAPGAGDSMTLKKETFQKRYLTDSLDNLFKKFCAESELKVSRATFFRFKPKWIVSHTASARDTCLCKDHTNFKFLLDKLALIKILPSKKTLDFIASMTCDPMNKSCMYRECPKCQNKAVNIQGHDEACAYYRWETKAITRPGAKGAMYTVKLTTKNKIDTTVAGLINEVNCQLPNFFKHSYNTGHQHKVFSKIQQNLEIGQIFCIVDFSQNYACKYSKEIQSVHFGASKKQVSLHTGAFFYKNETTNKIECVSFCTVSEDLRHDAAAIWAHMKPIFELMKTKVININTIYFQSDGPSTQYKNKTNFYLFQFFCGELNLERASWNFSTSGHGKSCADGTGGTVKRQCDRAVAHGKDVISAADIIETISSQKDSKVKMFLITTDDIKSVDPLIPQNLETIPKTKSVYQIIWHKEEPKTLFFGYLSCSDRECMLSPPCKHYSLNPSSYVFTTVESTDSTVEKPQRKARRKLSHQIKPTEKLGNSAELSFQDLEKGGWVAVLNNKTWCPAIIQEIDKEKVLINMMSRNGKKMKWPVKKKEQLIATELLSKSIICKISTPPTLDVTDKTRKIFIFEQTQYKFITQQCKYS